MAGAGRKRVITRQVHIQGGGGIVTGTANLSWGPAFGRGVGQEELQCDCVQLPLDAVGLEINQTCGCHASNDADDLDYGVFRTCGCTLGGTNNDIDVDFDFLIPTGATVTGHATVDAWALDYGAPRTCGGTASVPQIDVETNQTAGIHLSGTALGAPFWQSESHTSAQSAGNLVITTPTGTVDGDLLLAFITRWTNASIPGAVTPPAGWTEVSTAGGDTFAGTAAQFRHQVFRRIAASEGASYTFVPIGATDLQSVGEIHRISGVDTTTPTDAYAFATLNSSALNPDPAAPTVTTTVTNTLVFAYLCHDHLALNQSHTPAAGEVEHTDFESTTSLGSVIGASTQTKTFGAAAATGTVVFNCTETVSTDAIMSRVALRPGTTTLAA